MWGYQGVLFRFLCRKKCYKMSLVNKDAPIGVQMIQRLGNKLCPRLQINRLRWYQASVLLLTYLTYLTYHLTRKPISIVKNVLHQNCSALTPPPGVDPSDPTWCDWPPFNTSDANTLLGALDSAFLFSYAAAMFVSGMVAERVDLRYFLSLGMLVSAVFCYLFGLGRTFGVHDISYYLLVQAGAGIAQTTGWPGTVSVVSKWFGNSKKGFIFGVWNSHTSLGNILGTLMAAEYVETDWALSFIYPALAMGAVGTAVWLFLAPEPRAVGLDTQPASRQPSRSDDEEDNTDDNDETQVLVGDQAASLRPNRHSANASQGGGEPTESTALLRRPSAGAITFSRALTIPGVLEYSLSLFFAKLVSYTFLYWLPLYIKTSTLLTARDAGQLSTAFDAGGALGAALGGLAADASGCPALVCGAFYLASAPALFLYQAYGASSYTTNLVLLTVTGLLVNAPYALITTSISAELGTHSSLAGNTKALATVTAIIDGTGSIGAAIGPMLAGVVSSVGSWPQVFYMLIACNFAALFLLVRMAKSEISRLRVERRLASPPRVRIE